MSGDVYSLRRQASALRTAAAAMVAAADKLDAAAAALSVDPLGAYHARVVALDEPEPPPAVPGFVAHATPVPHYLPELTTREAQLRSGSNVARAIRMIRERGAPMSITELASALGADAPALSAQFRKAADAGYLVRTARATWSTPELAEAQPKEAEPTT